ncbi:MAG: FtsQ-type POTRA domain-containing protein [Pseudorhodoplanes sp.]|nr:Cell division protein FtsQ [Pseudorhodoplanes sp.]MBW7949281.1 FtsQ-type POTRA domain-containing protein [Pseudorhodoplanes sp.]MCL4711617.1 FtsQ-type POTRA domain-containing protein [Pseudorhodoplanes sp.]MCQ3943767.1 cell division protein FtsQ/DivIB [Alphaproteobacteria bacterium]GIK81490.1 MAG: cell division protein FtsQ [Alphaproteobacteria bacterium]
MDDRGRLAEPLTRSRIARARSSTLIRQSSEPGAAAGAFDDLSRLVARIPRGWGAAATFVFLLCALGYGAVRGGHADAALARIGAARDAFSVAAGFRTAHITITGNRKLSREDLLAAAGVSEQGSLLFLDADAARTRLKADPWIADATVLKLYPDRLTIAVIERQAFALWQKDGRARVIAEDGTVVQDVVDTRFADLPLVVGQGAEKRARDILAVAERFPAIRDQVRAYVFVAERRWNLRLKNGIDVRLPEDDPAQAFATLVTLDRDRKLLSRDVVAIDLRLADRVTVRLPHEAAAARAQALKDRKTRRKGDDA